MATITISAGTAHALPSDIQKALSSSKAARAAWESLTPLARNEWICWVISVKKEETRKEHRECLISKLKEGVRRPCCWIGCIHRKDKAVSPSVRGVLSKRSKK
ncbi:MAG: putative bacteriocin protection protein YdeI [Parcubacteria bacterium C7867-004]|nr:MAG: putative bacteriocin protection protein YdeI [Parcubacteria bacterium C7867-004]